MHAASAAIDRRMDALPLNRLHLLLFLVLGAGLMFDQMDGSKTTVITAVFAEPGSGVSRGALSSMLTAYYVVAAAGAPLMGIVADRLGRRIALVVTLAGFGILTATAVAMPDFKSLSILRVASSFMLSAVPPLVFSFIADTLPPKVRGPLMMLVSILSALGAALAPALTHWGNDLHPFGFAGWQMAMLVAALAGSASGIAALLLPESPRWLCARGRFDQAETTLQQFEASPPLHAGIPSGQACVDKPIAMGPDTRTGAEPTIRAYGSRLALVVVIMFLQCTALSGFALMLTKTLIIKGMTMQTALAQSSLILLAMPVGVVACAFITDRMERRTLILLMSVFLALSATIFGVAHSASLLLASGAVFSFFLTAHATIAQIYCAEIFPTAVRGTAMGFGYAAVRIGSACVPVVLLPLLLEHGPEIAFAAIAALVIGSGIITRAFGPAVLPRTRLT